MPAQHQMNMKKGFTALFFAFTTITGMSQQFDVSGNLSAPDLTEANSVWADFDNDGDMDLLLAGNDGIGFFTTIYRNDNGIFTDADPGLQGAVQNISAADWDGDQDIDLLIGGDILYRNDGNMVFTDVGTVTKANQQSIWADYDNDGDLDLLNIGWIETGSYLLTNNNGSFTDSGVLLPPGYSGDWGDFDNDGDLDILIGGYLASTDYNGALIYEQINPDSFALVTGSTVLNLKQVYTPDVHFFNADNDKDLEILVAGNPVSNARSVAVYDKPTSVYFELNNAFVSDFPVIPGKCALADADNDGDVDVVVSQYGLFTNNNNGKFERIDSLRCGNTSWANIDGDGDLDLLSYESFIDTAENFITETRLYINTINTSNEVPTPPANTFSNVAQNTATIGWDNGGDHESNSAQLSYNVWVSNAKNELINTPQTDSSDNFLLAQNGPIRRNSTTLTNLSDGVYRWKVQTIDGNFQASAFSVNKNFTVGLFVFIPDTNFFNYLINIGIDANNDGGISYGEARSVSQLDLTGLSIKDFTGIEAFTSLHYLTLSNNPVDSLFVNTLDQLISLHADSCQLNYLLVPEQNVLDTLSLKNNRFTDFNDKRLAELRKLDLSGNPLSELNLNRITKLRSLVLHHNDVLSNVVIDSLAFLSALNINHSGLNSLDIRNNQLLNTLNLDSNLNLASVCVWQIPFPPATLTVSTAGSPNLQFSPCLNEVFIPDANFKQAIIVNGVDANDDGFITYEEALPVENLEVSYRNIEDFTGINAFKNLKLFRAEGNLATSFNFDTTGTIELLNLNNNQLSSINLAPLVALKSLELNNNQLNNLNLSTLKNLETLIAEGNDFTSINSDSCALLNELNLNNNPNLSVLNLKNNPLLNSIKLSGSSITSLNTSAQRMLNTLILSDCQQLSDLNVKANLNLGVLELANTALTFLDLKNNEALNYLDLSSNELLTDVCVWSLPFPSPGLIFKHNTVAATNYSLCIQDENTWVASSDFPGSGIRFTSGFTINDTIYMGTGFSNAFEKAYWQFDPLTEAWTQIADYEGNEQYVNKGFDLNQKGYVYSHNDVSGSFWEYNPQTNNWTSLAPPTSGGHAAASGFQTDEAIYVFGGQQNGTKTNEFWKYDGLSWTALATGPSARTQAFGFADSTHGYIGGGTNTSNQALADFWQYEFASNTWLALSDLPEAIKEAVSVSHQGRLFYGGGTFFNNTYSNRWYEYVVEIDSIIARNALPGPNRSGAIALSAGAHIYFGTGYNAGTSFNDWWRYQPNIPSAIPYLSIAQQSITWYPNPAQHRIYFNASTPTLQVQLFDLQGKLLLQKTVTNGSLDLPEYLETGAYLLTITSAHGRQTDKILLTP